MSLSDGTLHEFTVPEDQVSERLDRFLHTRIPTLTRNQIQVLIKAGQVTDANGKTMWHKNHDVKPGQCFTVKIPEAKPTHLEPYKVDLDIVYEDEHLLVINKPAGMTVHPGAGTGPDTLVHALIAHCGESLSGIGGVARPGLIHRIDRDTTGLLVVAKNDRAHLSLSAQLRKREISREYLAFCWGTPPMQRGRVETYIGRSQRDRKKMAIYASGAQAKLAITNYVLEKKLANDAISLIRFKLETGRTHQIRVHAAHSKFPLIGDPVYGGTAPANKIALLSPKQKTAVLAFSRQALHAESLGFIHPVSLEYMDFKAPLPKDLKALLKALQA